jgi:hypothetical protein
MILDSPGTSPSVIAHAHGFSAVEVAELLPIFLDNLRTDFSSADGPAPELVPPAPQPGETAEEHADRYLRELAENERLDVVGYDTLGGANGDLDTDLDSDLDPDPTFLDAPAGDLQPGEIVTFDGGEDVDAVDRTDHDMHEDMHEADPMDDLAEDDPFAATAPPKADAPGAADAFEGDVFEDGAPAGADDPGEPFAIG